MRSPFPSRRLFLVLRHATCPRCQPSGRSTRTSTATAMVTKMAAIGFQRPMLMMHCSDAPTIQAVPVSASGTAVPDNTATAAKRAGGCATTELGVELGKSPINEPSAPRASTPPETLAIGRRGVSPPAPGADMPEPPDPRCAIEIRVRLFGFCTVLLHTLLL